MTRVLDIFAAEHCASKIRATPMPATSPVMPVDATARSLSMVSISCMKNHSQKASSGARKPSTCYPRKTRR